jgi:hypothetical protein
MARTIVVYGPLEGVEAKTVRVAAANLGAEALFFQEPAAVARRLEEQSPLAVLVSSGCEGAVEVLCHLRGSVRHAAVPALIVGGDRTDLAFGEAYEQGADDLASARSLRGLVARLRQLASGERVAPETRGSVVCAGASSRWRTIMGRTLTNAGLVPRFVNNVPDATEQACAPDVRFVVASDDLQPDGATVALERARAKGSMVPWIIVGPARRAVLAGLATRSLPGVACVDVHAPPDHVLFVANELSRPQLGERRSSERLLFGTAVSFRAAGAAEDDIGFTYNIAASGLFVRTLAPLEAGQDVWLELWPPRTERAVRLVGRIAWRRAFGPAGEATVPPGFGVRLVGGLPGDLERWEAAYRALGRPAPTFRKEVWESLSSVPPSLTASTVS